MSKKLITPMLLAVLLTACSLHYGMTASASEIDGTPSPVPDIASAADNALYWINKGTTYRSGAALQFYATGAGYGPKEPQELNPVNKSTRYIPVSWKVSTKSQSGTRSAKGTWRKYTEETTRFGKREYRFRASFTLKTVGSVSVPYKLKVTYKKQVYNGTKKSWQDSGNHAYKSVDFYIRNTATPTVISRPGGVSIYPSNTPVLSIKNNSKIEVGSKKQLKVSNLSTRPIFSSSDKKVAKINKKTGEITALKAGTAIITVKAPAIGQYDGYWDSISIRAVPKTIRITSAVSRKKGRLTIKGTASSKNITGYKIQYQYSFGDINTVVVKSNKILNHTIKGLKSGKRCRARVCAFKKVKGKIFSGYYSHWADAGKIR